MKAGRCCCFTGVGENPACAGTTGNACGGDVVLCPLYGALTLSEQRQAILPAPQGKRKVVLATNIAETSFND